MPATFQASSFLLTYPQSTFELDDLRIFLADLGATFCRIASEQHADGSLHRHALVHFPSKLRVGPRHFDFNGRHPNIRTVGRKKTDWENCIAYVSKDGEFLEYGTPRHDPNSSIWSTIARASSRQEAEEILKSEKPRDFILNARNFDYWLDKVCLSYSLSQVSALILTIYILDVPIANECTGFRATTSYRIQSAS